MPDRERLMSELTGENDVGVLLIAQMGGVPNELQLIVQTAQYDPAAQGLRERSAYIIRVLGVREHRLTLGLFPRLFFAQQHPILLHHNEPLTAVHFEGRPADVNELALDIHQAHASTFGPWRELARDLNREKPLVDLLSSGGGLLGEMPRSAAERMARVLAHHGLQARLEQLEPERDPVDEHGRSQMWQMLGIGDSYFVALSFAVDRMQGRARPASG
jgi:hypothetical protein